MSENMRILMMRLKGKRDSDSIKKKKTMTKKRMVSTQTTRKSLI